MEKLLLKYIDGQASDEERRKVLEWIEADPTHKNEYQSLHKAYVVSVWEDIEEQEESAVPRKNNIIRLSWLRTAAAVLLVISLFWNVRSFIWKEKSTLEDPMGMQTVHVPAGQRVELILQDGTKVWLNANSTFRFPGRFDAEKREVYLNGEGRLDVVHNEHLPFIVKTENYAVKVLGTDFNVKAYGTDNFETALMSGRVEIESAKGKKFILHPNQKVVEEHGNLRIDTIGNMDPYRWREGLLCFENESVESLFQKVEIYYHIKITNKNKKLANRRYTGKFWMDDGVEHMLRVLQLNNDFTYQRDFETNEYIIH
ncbi:ferric-dicitrate binding protein FerR, regulates iron transport through sigma-19 [Pedobacter steynii]|uniref:Ferric-dicitrate binding protein FerR, regulates iron transport through sigma-19 n=1 Tax=Pedobacter steynii TaxID=430522 RepID=A0A1H0G245_9SPHI|nr:FecR domain-containing protein [Pedobacter steynii]NQX42297.1 FecR domain-containing protein [Pedobacter steynii]SDO00956.1 ferric-dicitrate binding protein FerR, regulates iron transport through sigma-19 [Pedobacter steynii]